MYLTFDEFDAFGGEGIMFSEFQRLEYKARKRIDEETFGRIAMLPDIPEAVKRLVFELIDVVGQEDQPVVTSVSNDGYSESYAASTADSKDKIYDLIVAYLACEKTPDGTPLLYRGVSSE